MVFGNASSVSRRSRYAPSAATCGQSPIESKPVSGPICHGGAKEDQAQRGTGPVKILLQRDGGSHWGLVKWRAVLVLQPEGPKLFQRPDGVAIGYAVAPGRPQ